MSKQCSGCFSLYDNELKMCPVCGYFSGAQPYVANHLFVGTELASRYVIGNVLGYGGFGVTYKAWDKKLDTVVAVKEYYPANFVNRAPGTESVIVLSGNARYQFDHGLSNFIDEARNIAKFGLHRNIVNVYDYFESNNTAYIVMEFLSGCNLKKRIDDSGGRIGTEECLHYAFNVLNALKDIHSGGIIHRDISPDNIFLCDNGSVKLIDFGAARLSSTDEAKNYTVILKRGFAPPEQYENISDQGPKTDIYALGATMYYCLTGQRPDESISRKINDTLIPPNEIDSSVESYVSDSIMKAMSLEPVFRFSDADEFERSLKKEIKIKKTKRNGNRKKQNNVLTALLLFALATIIPMFFFISSFSGGVTASPQETQIIFSYAVDELNESDLKTVYAQVISEFCKEYPNVKIVQEPFEYADYELFVNDVVQGKRSTNLLISPQKVSEMLLQAGMLVDISTSIDFSQMIYSSMSGKYSFPSFQSVELPFSVTVPVVYLNTSCAKADISSITALKDLETVADEEHLIVVDEKYADEFERIFGTVNSEYIVYGTCEQFASGNYAAFFSDTSNYYAVKKMPSMLTGIPKVVEIDAQRLPCSSNEFCSVIKSSNDYENEVSLYFLKFLFSENVQSRLFSSDRINSALPVNVSALKTFVSVYTDLNFIFE